MAQIIHRWIKNYGKHIHWNIIQHKKEISTETCYNMDKLTKYMLSKKSREIGHILYDSLYMKYPE